MPGHAFSRRLEALESSAFIDDVVERYAQDKARRVAATLAEMDRMTAGECRPGEDPAEFVDRARATIQEGLDGPPRERSAALAALEPYR